MRALKVTEADFQDLLEYLHTKQENAVGDERERLDHLVEVVSRAQIAPRQYKDMGG